MRIAINGFGRIGRLIFRTALEKKVNIHAINDPHDITTIAHLLKYDSVHGELNKKIIVRKDHIIVDGKKIMVYNSRDPEELPWRLQKIDLVLECSGHFKDSESAGKHLKAGAKKVILSAPSKDKIIPTFVYGVNHNKIRKTQKIISNASCTTNCLTPIVQIINKKYGINNAFMSTIHAMTNSQPVVDAARKDLRRARAAANNIIPTTTGATIATCKVLPELSGKLQGMAFRVPVAAGSLIDLTINLKKASSREELNKFFIAQAKKMKGVITCTDEEVVSSDIVHNSHSAIIDLKSTQVNKKVAKVIAWYDNEWGYSNRMIDLIKHIKSKKIY